jgi:hypothetical protein
MSIIPGLFHGGPDGQSRCARLQNWAFSELPALWAPQWRTLAPRWPNFLPQRRRHLSRATDAHWTARLFNRRERRPTFISRTSQEARGWRLATLDEGILHEVVDLIPVIQTQT